MSSHEDFTRGVRAKTPSERSFGVVWCGFFVIAGLWPLLENHPPRYWAFGMAALLAVVTWLRPRLLRRLNRLWFSLGLLIGRVATPLVSGVMFFLVFAPMGTLARLFRRDPLRLRWNAGADSYWLPRNPPGPPPETMTHQF